MAKKVYVLTGAVSGMALASARALVEEGTLLLADLRSEALEKVKRQFDEVGADVYTYACDLSDPEAAKGLAEYAAGLGDVYAVIHCAGVSCSNSPKELVLRVNIFGTINMVNAFYPVLAPEGVMICFSSKASYAFETTPQMSPMLPMLHEIFSHWNESDFYSRLDSLLVDTMKLTDSFKLAGAAYTVGKYFVKRFVLMNVQRFADKGCRILSISPGSYLTPMHQALIDNYPDSASMDMASIPMKRWGHPYEMAALVKFLCSRGAGYITGVDILPDGGGTLSAGVPQVK